MSIAVRYISRGGNTKKVAEAIAAAAVDVEAHDCGTPVTEPVDLMFLGGAVYAFGLDEEMASFIGSLDVTTVKAVAVFGTSAIVKSGNSKITALLKAKGIRVLEEEFYCRGEFKFMHKSRPNADDLDKAARFAERAMSGLDI